MLAEYLVVTEIRDFDVDVERMFTVENADCEAEYCVTMIDEALECDCSFDRNCHHIRAVREYIES